MKRRHLLGSAGALATGALALSACSPPEAEAPLQAAWVGARFDRGHRLQVPQPAELKPATQQRAGALVLGGGIAGLAAARGLLRAGVDDVRLLELDDTPGGNSRGHRLGGIACPLGAHYLPLPGPESTEVAEWLHEIGLLKTELGRTVADERHLCHSPQERLFFDGAWSEGLLPPAEPNSETARQYRRFAQAVAALQKGGSSDKQRAFALPAHRSAWGAEQQALNATTFDTWLEAQGFTAPELRWYLDYCCRDDYGAGSAVVSAWAGIHYFASRHGFHAPGEHESRQEGEREGLFTWPEGNAWLVQRLAAPLGERVLGGRTVLRVDEQRHGVQVLAFNEATQQLEGWSAPQVVLALPLFVAARVLAQPPQALRDAAALLTYAPWLVANLHLAEPLLQRHGAPPSWDNVVYGSSALGYVDAMHQSLRPVPGPTVLTAYLALAREQRPQLLGEDAATWAERVLQELKAVHPDLRRRLQRLDLMRWGHAMAVPRPGLHRHPVLQALRALRGRVRFAHADLAAYSVFEEAFTAGCEAALAPLR